MATRKTLLLSRPEVDREDHRLVNEALASHYLTAGPFLERFEREMTARFGARFAVGVSSGTAGLHIAMIAARVGDGDLVVTSPFSFVASGNAILYERGVPIFVDIDAVTLTMDPGRTAEAIDTLAHRRPGWRRLLPRSGGSAAGALRAVLPVHIFGRPVEMGPVMAAARAAGVTVVEDACEAIGAGADGVLAGRWGHAGIFGFFPNKQITAGEGGMILTDDEDWAALAMSLRNQGRSADAACLRHDRLGFNYRLDEMSAALGLSQLRRLDELLGKRARVAREYTARLADIDGVSFLAPARPGMTLSWFLYSIRLAAEIDRDHLMARLADRGIMTRPYFWPIHLQPFYRQRFGYAPGDFPCSEAAGHSMLALPMSPNLPEDDMAYVCEAVKQEIAAIRKPARPPVPPARAADLASPRRM